MAEITVDLQDGFKDDTVTVSAGGREVMREEGVTTRFQIGMARSLQVAVPEGEVTLEVEVSTKNASATVADRHLKAGVRGRLADHRRQARDQGPGATLRLHVGSVRNEASHGPIFGLRARLT